MRIIYQEKKVFVDLIINAYLFIIFVLGGFFSFDNFFAYSSGINLNQNIPQGARGISVIQLINGTSGQVHTDLQRLLSAILVLLVALFILNLINYFFISKQNKQLMNVVEIGMLLVFLILIALNGTLFSIATRQVDYTDLRVYGTALFGIGTLLSFLFVGLAELILIIYSFFQLDSKDVPAENYIIENLEGLHLHNISIWYYILFGLMIVQNASFFALSDATTKLILFLDIIGIVLLGIISIYFGHLKKLKSFTMGGISLIIWVVLSLFWRQAFGIYSNSTNIQLGSLSNTIFLISISIIISSLFLGYGLYSISKYLTLIFKPLRIIVSSYIIANTISSILLLVIFGIYLKLLLIPLLGIIMYGLLIYYMHKNETGSLIKS